MALPMRVRLINLLSSDAFSAEPISQLNCFPRLVHEFFVENVETVRAKIRECFGPEPERTPLNSRITGIVERDDYKVEKLVFTSCPGFPVTANVYILK